MVRHLAVAVVVLALCASLVVSAHAQSPSQSPTRSAAKTPWGPDEPVLQRVQRTATLRIGFRPDGFPFSYKLGTAAEPVGFAIDLCRRVADAIQKRLNLPELRRVYVPVDSVVRFDAVAKGEIDIECADTTNTKERRETLRMDFSIPYYFAGARTLVPAASPIRKIADLAGKRVITTKGTTSVELLQQRAKQLSPSLRYMECDADSQCVDAVAQGKADAFVMDDITLYSLRAASPKPDRLKVVGELMSIEPLAAMVRVGQKELAAVINAELASMMRDGSFREIYRKWFQSATPPENVNLDLPMNYLLKDSMKHPTANIGDDFYRR